MGSFHSMEFASYPTIYSAVGFLRQEYIHSLAAFPPNPHTTELEDDVLRCLFSITILIQESTSLLSDDSGVKTVVDTLAELELFLRDSQDTWGNSVQKLRSILYGSLTLLFEDGTFKVDYVTDLVQVLGTLSVEARQGVGKCLLNLLYLVGNKDHTLWMDDGWTPDSLLSSMHGH